MAIKWLKRGREFWSSTCGRFDVFHGQRAWVAVDADLGRVRHYAGAKEAKEACAATARGPDDRGPHPPRSSSSTPA